MSTNEEIQPTTLIVEEISSLISKEEFDRATDYLTKTLIEKEIYENTWDLATYLFQVAEKPSDKLCNDYRFFAEDALNHLAQHGNPRELLIIMLEQSDRFLSDESFLFHLKLFAILIRRLPLKASLQSSIEDIFTLLKCHLTTLELPSINNDVAGKDLLIYNHDRRVVHLLDLTQFYVDFVCQLRDYFSSTSMNDFVPNLSKYLISILQDPLISLSYEPIDAQESSSFVSIRPLLNCLLTLNGNPLKFLRPNDDQSMLIYLLLTKVDYFSQLPCVYSAQFYLFVSLPSIERLSEDRDCVMWTEKSAVLVSTVCSRLNPSKEFDETIFDFDQIHRLIDALKNLMVRSPARQYAPLTIGAYRSLFQSFDRRARSVFLQQQLNKTPLNEDSYRTFLCSLLKDEFLYDYRSASNEIYHNRFLVDLLDRLCQLPNGIESDLLEIYDCLCTTLNFIRFLGLINRTLIPIEHFNEKFLKPLRKSIDIARAHYKLEVKNRQENSIKPSAGEQTTDILVDNKSLPTLTSKEQVQSLQMVLTKFDILDCIFSSVTETFAGYL